MSCYWCHFATLLRINYNLTMRLFLACRSSTTANTTLRSKSRRRTVCAVGTRGTYSMYQVRRYLYQRTSTIRVWVSPGSSTHPTTTTGSNSKQPVLRIHSKSYTSNDQSRLPCLEYVSARKISRKETRLNKRRDAQHRHSTA